MRAAELGLAWRMVNPLASGGGIGSFSGVKRQLTPKFFSKMAIWGVGFVLWFGLMTGLWAQPGFDAGTGAVNTLRTLEGARRVEVKAGSWLRIRGLALAAREGVAREREALRALRGHGLRICALVEWDDASWTGGVRAGGGRRVAMDLREVWARARELGRAFAGCVDVWEIGNEPDISFLEENPETYAAYLKMCRLGLLAGAKEAEDAENKMNVGGGGGGSAKEHARVVMAALALPPGPYFERLWANGAGGATDGFNFHFYGYSEDFSDVYGQFRDAAERSGDLAHVAGSESATGPAVSRELPVFMTESGYGLMDAAAGRTKEGRTRQWRWFRDVGEQLRALRPEAAMAFVLTPYLEQGQSEFGLLMEGSAAAAGGKWSADDFGRTNEGPWMQGIGRNVGEGAETRWVSPALAWLSGEENRLGGKSLSWRVAGAVSDSPVVLDFVARDGLEQRKSFLGYFVGGFSRAGNPAGWGEVIVYNFSKQTVHGVLALGEGLTSEGKRECALRLAPGERRSVRVRVEVAGAIFRGVRSETTFAHGNAEERSVIERLVTTLWPDPTAMTAEVVSEFARAEKAAEVTAERLLTRWRASEEPALQRQGRWLVSRGVSVTEDGTGTWRFAVNALPEEPLRPAMVELPLPDGFVFAPGMLLELSYRLAERSAETEAWLDVYFRTENGSLYEVWPRLRAGRGWRGYADAAENFTMAFYGRAKLPWRFAENKPVALVFFLRPEKLPAVFEIENAAITRRMAE